MNLTTEANYETVLLHCTIGGSVNSDVFAAINPAVRELSDGWEAGKKALCLTIENARQKTRWVQVVDNGLNVGLERGEGPDTVKSLMGLRNHAILAEEGSVGKFYFFKFNVKLDRNLVETICDVISRGDIKHPDSLNVIFDEL